MDRLADDTIFGLVWLESTWFNSSFVTGVHGGWGNHTASTFIEVFRKIDICDSRYWKFGSRSLLILPAAHLFAKWPFIRCCLLTITSWLSISVNPNTTQLPPLRRVLSVIMDNNFMNITNVTRTFAHFIGCVNYCYIKTSRPRRTDDWQLLSIKAKKRATHIITK